MYIQLWRLTSIFDDDMNYEMIYEGTIEKSNDFIKKYIKKIYTVYPYYDRIYVVEKEDDLYDNFEFINISYNEMVTIYSYVDVVLYKSYLNKKMSCLEKCIKFYTV